MAYWKTILWDDILLHLARLTDDHIVSGRKNLSFLAIPNLESDAEFKVELQNLVDAAVQACAFAKDIRNRRLAHRDFAVALSANAKPLAFASRRDVEMALTALHAILDRISRRYMGNQLTKDVLGSLTGAESLLYVLRDGVRAESARLQRLQSGALIDEDLAPPDPL